MKRGIDKTIFLIRHGQTDYNLKGIVQGSRVDADLNDTGFQQAEKFFQKYKDIPFDKIYTSKLKRTIQTVQKFIDKGISWEAYAGLNEISWGDQDGVAVNSTMHEYYQYVSKEWASGNLSLQIGGGESPLEVLERQKPVVKMILKERPDEKTILVCMHGRAIRILLCYLTNKSLCEMDTFEHSNLCLYKLHYNGEVVKVLSVNDIDHLK